MAKFKGLIDKPASKTSLTIKIDAQASTLHEEVKQLVKDTGSKLNLDRILTPILLNILQDAKHQLVELKQEQTKANTLKTKSDQQQVSSESV